LSRVNIIGGSIAGLIAARELASSDVGTTIFEEHREIGIPEKCDGLVSAAGIAELGIVPPSHTVQNRLTSAVFFSPSMKEIRIDAKKQNVIVLDRSRFDKFLAENAARAGAKIELGSRVTNYSQSKEETTIELGSQTRTSDVLLDCSGYESFIHNGGDVFQAGQYLVYGKWFEKSTVEVYLDPQSAPGFFKWVIPLSSDVAKIGVAGKEINTFSVLDSFVKEKNAVPFRKAAAPIICSGTIKKFVDARIVKAGDAAGQPKPTTGGGIFTGGFGGLLAAQAIASAFEANDMSLLGSYEENWRSKFGEEFRTQLFARNAFAKMTPKQLDQLADMINSSDIPRKISDEGDFDRHSIAIMKAFGMSNLFSILGMVVSNEIKGLLS
jgi:digeranylgeranylglycerophospholipid reductase